MSVKIEIRQAMLSDKDELDRLYNEIDNLHHAKLPDFFRSSEEMERPFTFLADRLADENTHIFVAEGETRLAGMILLKRKTQEHILIYPHQYLHISTLIVAQEFQGKGVAQKLLDTAVTLARTHTLPKITLNVYEFNQRAIAFYEKEGFETASRQMWLNI
jgi:ribosomal protein S18 acetylase RimI-like enzyme